jgi:hypothetical protein
VALAWALGCQVGTEPAQEREAPAPQRAEQKPAPAPARDMRLPAAHVPSAAPIEEPEPPEAREGPRTVPPGTPPAIAKVFQRLPVALQDGPPVGAIGASGIHIDKIWVGSRYERDGCTGESERFSLAKHDQVNVCFRVVHSRAEESVEVLWEKDGETFRRRGLTIPDLHAYRTRAYLVLRREYIGNWTAKVRSSDGIELAAISFAVTE